LMEKENIILTKIIFNINRNFFIIIKNNIICYII
jgi:hypothetical protein